ncbi:MAG: hypothetical protein AB7E55_01080 [Pigmentiphaga sp.]
MICPFCGGLKHTKTLESRRVKKINGTRRRRQCQECGARFTTFELIESENTTLDQIETFLNASVSRAVKKALAQAKESK